MTILDVLKARKNPEPIYKFASASFISEFKKSTKELGWTDGQVKEALDKFEKAHHARTRK